MRRFHRAVTAVGAAVVMVVASGPRGLAQTNVRPEFQTVHLLRGSITGTVVDEGGGPLAGVVVSALGATMAMAVSDGRGYFALDALPTGEYVVQAHLTGFAGSLRERVQVGAASPAVRRFQLRKIAGPVGTAGAVTPVSARPIMAAGFGLPGSTLIDQPDAPSADASADHPHTEIAWRLRHVKRSILKDANGTVTFADDDPSGDDGDVGPGAALWRAVDATANLATSLLGDMPLSGEVNLLTSGAFAPGDLFTGETVPRGVAYLSLGLPTAGGDWTMRAAMSEGDLSSWNVAGAYVSKPGAPHGLNFGLT
ncbi:MAG: carboxypeptidase-like regulatory domain-containing protein, partial [Vicinamibacterales bacterium]